MKNLFADIPAHLPDELTTALVTRPDVRLERIVSRGHASPPGFWYDQDEDEWVILLRGAARLEIMAQGEHTLGPGDHLMLPAHCRHRVTWTDPEQETIWLALFLPPDTKP